MGQKAADIEALYWKPILGSSEHQGDAKGSGTSPQSFAN